MYNIDLLKNEKIIDIFDEVFIKQGNQEKYTTIAITNKRLLFLDYFGNTFIEETLRIAQGVSYLRMKKVYFIIDRKDIKRISKKDYYNIELKDNIIEFDNEDIYQILKEK